MAHSTLFWLLKLGVFCSRSLFFHLSIILSLIFVSRINVTIWVEPQLDKDMKNLITEYFKQCCNNPSGSVFCCLPHMRHLLSDTAFGCHIIVFGFNNNKQKMIHSSCGILRNNSHKEFLLF